MYNQNVSVGQLERPKDVLCFATEWLDEPYGPDFFSEWEHGRKGMAQGIRTLLDEADAVITYNGDKFDLPHLRALMLTEGLTPPSPYKSIDLYKTMKQFELPFRKLG
jgi:DNA polymerase elongation subunit (family B)